MNKTQRTLAMFIAIIMVATCFTPIFATNNKTNNEYLHQLIQSGKTIAKSESTDVYNWSREVETYVNTQKTTHYDEIVKQVNNISKGEYTTNSPEKLTAYLLDMYYKQDYDLNSGIEDIKVNEGDENKSDLEELYIYLLAIKVKDFNEKYKSSVYDEVKILCTNIIEKDELDVASIIQLNRDLNIMKAEIVTTKEITTETTAESIVTSTMETTAAKQLPVESTTLNVPKTTVPKTTVPETTTKESKKDYAAQKETPTQKINNKIKKYCKCPKITKRYKLKNGRIYKIKGKGQKGSTVKIKTGKLNYRIKVNSKGKFVVRFKRSLKNGQSVVMYATKKGYKSSPKSTWTLTK